MIQAKTALLVVRDFNRTRAIKENNQTISQFQKS